MARIILITGGCRSGKSAYAQQLGESLAGRRAYVATCRPTDDEMRERVRRHRKARSAAQWETIEETIDLAGTLARAGGYDVVLVDCLTLWIANLLEKADREDSDAGEECLAQRCREILVACRAHPGTVLFVTNEVGMGIVPENALARRFRDLVGRCNQVIAAAADRVMLMSCGIPIAVKGA